MPSSVAFPAGSQEKDRRDSPCTGAGDPVVRGGHQLFVYHMGGWRIGMDLREFAKRTLNLKNHTGTISIIGKSL